MAGITDRALYPPLVNSFMPTFLQTAKARVYFSITPYNNLANIKHVQAVLRYAQNNLNALDASAWPSEIMLKDISADNSVVGDYKYFIEIDPARDLPVIDSSGRRFAEGQYYKVQLRLSDASAIKSGVNYIDPSGDWFKRNLGYFSEWSTVCLIKGIPAPLTSVRIKDGSAYNGIGYFMGQYGNRDLAEPLAYYQATLYDGTGTRNLRLSTEKIPVDSSLSTLTTDSSGNFYTEFPFRFNTVFDTTGSVHSIDLTFYTKNGFSTLKRFDFRVAAFISRTFTTKTTTLEPENGRIKFHLESGVTGPLLIRRSDYRSNFLTWETLLDSSSTAAVHGDFYDYSVESGVLYKYWVSGNNLTDASAIMVFDDIFLVGDTQQLKVKFNPRVSSLRYVVADSKTETLGGIYPFVRRNGNMKYREFSIGGLVSYLMDDNNLFAADIDLYGNYATNYATYNTTNGISPYTDYIKEREFREKVLEFLYDGKVKLFKSTSEGNILVKLTDISLSPIDSLGRRLYEFSATATEIDSYSIENCKKYNVRVV